MDRHLYNLIQFATVDVTEDRKISREELYDHILDEIVGRQGQIINITI